MKIAYVHPDTEFNKIFYEKLMVEMKDHDLASWVSENKAPHNDFDVVIVMGKFSKENMSGQTKLKLIQTMSAGYDGIDIDAASDKGIAVSFAPSGETGNAISVAEFAVSLLINASRNLNQLINSNANADAIPVVGSALYGKTVCILGLGTIGKLLIKRLTSFEVKLVVVDDHPEFDGEGINYYKTTELNKAVKNADYLVISIRATEENKNLINSEIIDCMKKGSVLINIARGSLVDESALIQALKSGHIAYSGLDVVKNEPIQSDNPLIKLPNVILTPHVAAITDITLDGTIKYLGQVISDLSNGVIPEKTIVNH